MTDAAMIDAEERQKLVKKAATQIAREIFRTTGNAPRAVVLVVHFQDDVMFGAEMQDAPPQVSLNVVENILFNLRKLGESMKTAIMVRRERPPGTTTQ